MYRLYSIYPEEMGNNIIPDEIMASVKQTFRVTKSPLIRALYLNYLHVEYVVALQCWWYHNKRQPWRYRLNSRCKPWENDYSGYDKWT